MIHRSEPDASQCLTGGRVGAAVRSAARTWRRTGRLLTAAAVAATIAACANAPPPTAPDGPPPPEQPPPPPLPPPPPPGQPGLLSVCYPTGSLETDHVVSDVNVSQGTARVGCAAAPPPSLAAPDGFCNDWRACTRTGADGLTYLAFLVRGDGVGGHIRFRPNTFDAVLVLHPGGGGTTWLDQPPGRARAAEWVQLEQSGVRTVGVRWVDTGLSYFISAGRFTRNTPEGTTLGALAARPAAVIQWIDDQLNPAGRPIGVTGPSAGADASLSPFIARAPVADRIRFLGLISYAPFFNFVNACNQLTPPGRFVDPATGLYAASGAPATLTLEGNTGVRRFPDNVWRLTACQTQSVTPAIAAGSSAEGLLDALLAEGRRYRGAVFFSVGTLNGSDNVTGTTWAAGGLFNHPFFADASRRVWSECRTSGHSHQFDTGSPCLAEIVSEAGRALLP